MKKLALDESNHPVLAFLCFLLSYCIMYVFNTKYKSNIELILRSILLETVFNLILQEVSRLFRR